MRYSSFQLRLMQSELNIEEVVKERSMKVKWYFETKLSQKSSKLWQLIVWPENWKCIINKRSYKNESLHLWRPIYRGPPCYASFDVVSTSMKCWKSFIISWYALWLVLVCQWTMQCISCNIHSLLARYVDRCNSKGSEGNKKNKELKYYKNTTKDFLKIYFSIPSKKYYHAEGKSFDAKSSLFEIFSRALLCITLTKYY